MLFLHYSHILISSTSIYVAWENWVWNSIVFSSTAFTTSGSITVSHLSIYSKCCVLMVFAVDPEPILRIHPKWMPVHNKAPFGWFAVINSHTCMELRGNLRTHRKPKSNWEQNNSARTITWVQDWTGNPTIHDESAFQTQTFYEIQVCFC